MCLSFYVFLKSEIQISYGVREANLLEQPDLRLLLSLAASLADIPSKGLG